jgi:hypothetical protein
MTNFTPAQLLNGSGHEKYEKGYFDGGLKEVAEAVGLPLHLYHACFDATTGYSKANGGDINALSAQWQNPSQTALCRDNKSAVMAQDSGNSMSPQAVVTAS